MKLLRYGDPGAEKPGLMDSDGTLRDLSGVLPDISADAIASGALARIASSDTSSLPAVSGKPRMGPPVAGVGKVICIGLNFVDHAEETGMPIPAEPIVFMKGTSSIIGPNDNVVLPRGSQKGDWEVELGIVIGKHAKYVSEANALDYVAGYCVVNDVSERALQLESTGQWDKGKTCDTFCPFGPWLVTADEVADPQALDMWLEVNGKRYQNGNSKTMIFNCAQIISYLSSFVSLYPGDLIATGTPPGVGAGMKPPVFLKPGDVMKVGIQGLGEQTQNVLRDE